MSYEDDCSLEYALVIIKPDAMICREEIIRIIVKEGFHILIRKKFHLSPEQAAEFLKDWEELKVFMIMVYNLSNGPLEAMIVARDCCYEYLKQLLGLWKSIHDRFYCLKKSMEINNDKIMDLQNVIYGSRTHKEAVRDIHFFFPNFIIEPSNDDEEIENFCCKPNFMKLLMEGIQKLSMEKSPSPILRLSNWLLENSPERPKISVISYVNVEEEKANDFMKVTQQNLDRTISQNTSSLLSSDVDEVIMSESTDTYPTSSFSKSLIQTLSSAVDDSSTTTTSTLSLQEYERKDVGL